PLPLELRGFWRKNASPPRATSEGLVSPDTPVWSIRPGEPAWELLGQGLILLPDGPAHQQRPHHAHQVVRRGHQRNLLPLRVATLGALEVRADRHRKGAERAALTPQPARAQPVGL